MHRALTLVFALVGIAACNAAGAPLAGHDGLTLRLQNFYADRATEEGGMCPTPRLRSVTASEVVEESDERLVLRVRYYFDDSSFGDFGSDPLGLVPRVSCRGFATRTFTIALGPNGASEVLEMTGPQRSGTGNFGVGGRTRL